MSNPRKPRTRSSFKPGTMKTITTWEKVPRQARGVQVGFTVKAREVEVPCERVLEFILDRFPPFGHPQP